MEEERDTQNQIKTTHGFMGGAGACRPAGRPPSDLSRPQPTPLPSKPRRTAPPCSNLTARAQQGRAEQKDSNNKVSPGQGSGGVSGWCQWCRWVLHPGKWVLDRSPVHFLTFVLELCTWIKNIAVEKRSCVVGWNTLSSIQGQNALIPRAFCT